MPLRHHTDGDVVPCRPFFLALTIVAVAAVAQRYGLSNRTLVLTLTAWAVTFSDVAVRQYNEGAGVITRLVCAAVASTALLAAQLHVGDCRLCEPNKCRQPVAILSDCTLTGGSHALQARCKSCRCSATRCRAGCRGRWSRRGGCPTRRCTPGRAPATCSARQRAQRRHSQQRCSTLSHIESNVLLHAHAQCRTGRFANAEPIVAIATVVHNSLACSSLTTPDVVQLEQQHLRIARRCCSASDRHLNVGIDHDRRLLS